MASFSQNLSRRDFLQLLAATTAAGLVLPGFTNSRSMISKKIPSTNEQLPVIGLGTWQTFDVGSSETDRAPLMEVLKLLADKGAKVIDSSPMYGRSEEVVGDLLAEQKLQNQFFLATKVWTTGREAGVKQMQDSMRLMRTTKLDLMQIHNLVDWQTHLKTLRSWKEEGKIRYIGITHYHSGAYGQVEKVLQTEKLDFLQIDYSISNRDAEQRILPLAQEKGVAVLINQPFDSGSLFQRTKGKPLPEWAKEYGIASWAQFFLKFIVAHPAVTCAIPGTSKPKHLLDNLAAGYGELPDEKGRRRMVEVMKSF